jgi:hypothetical protein
MENNSFDAYPFLLTVFDLLFDQNEAAIRLRIYRMYEFSH